MALRRLVTQVTRHHSEFRKGENLFSRSYFSINKYEGFTRNSLCCSQERFQSRYVGNLASPVCEADEANEVAHLNELYNRNDPEAVIKAFQSQSSLHANSSALCVYFKALVKVDRLDESELLKTLQRGPGVNEEVQPSVELSTKLSDVIGVVKAKKELGEIVSYLRDPERFTRLGVKPSKCYLLVGPSGTGKTMLARAVAGESGLPFFSCCGHEFQQMSGHAGAQRMRDLFAAAKKRSPCIIFIDDIDEIYNQTTLNQLLVELDGFNQNDGITVIAATNFSKSLDKALVKHGRFDRRVVVPKPNSEGRHKHLESLLSKVPKAGKVNFMTGIIARMTPEFSPADLANMVNLAALYAAEDGAKAVTFLDHIYPAVGKIRREKGYANPNGIGGLAGRKRKILYL